MHYEEEIREFLIESNENLATLDREIVELEQHPKDARLIASVFRTIHTIKGTCGFFGFSILGSVTHIAENILSQVREEQRDLTPELISLILEAVDAVKTILTNIEASGEEGADVYQGLRQRLEAAHGAFKGSAAAAHGAAESEEAALKVNAVPIAGVSEARTAELPAQSADIAGEPEQITALDLKGPGVGDSTIRVDVGLLDKLMNLVGELVLARNQILQGNLMQNAALSGTSQRLNLITSELQEGVMKTRMQPIGVVWNKLPRVVRDLAAECGKRIQIEMVGAETELDKTIIEAIKDPLTHIVRNACDHGIEMPEVRVARGKSMQGTLLLRAYHEGGHVNIEISDDGGGVDAEKLKSRALQKGLIRPEQAAQMGNREALHLVFLPGFSTAEKVTSISGRGVGMDVVKTNVEKIGGSVDIFNRAEPASSGGVRQAAGQGSSGHGLSGQGPSGQGSTVKIKIPLTLAIIPGLIVTLDNEATAARDGKAEKQRFVIPQANLVELVRLEGADGRKQIEDIHGTQVYRRREKLLPLTYLSQVLGRTHSRPETDVLNIVILQAEDRQFGLVVDGISDTQEIVVKPLGKQLKGLSCYVGATIMGDGKVALILDVPGLARLAGIVGQTREVARAGAGLAERSGGTSEALLLFQTGKYERLVVSLSLVARLEEFAAAKVEYAAGLPVIDYRGSILSLISLGSLLDPGSEDRAMRCDPLQVIVFRQGSRQIGLVVERIVDIVEETVTIRRSSQVPGLLGSGLVNGKITDFVDLHALIQSSGENWLDATVGQQSVGSRLLLVDPSPVPRVMLRNYLEISGYEVTEAASGAECMERLAHDSIDAVLTAVDAGAGTGSELVRNIRSERKYSQLPILGLVNHADELPGDVSGAWGATGNPFNDVRVRMDRQGLVESIEALIRGMKTTAELGAR